MSSIIGWMQGKIHVQSCHWPVTDTANITKLIAWPSAQEVEDECCWPHVTLQREYKSKYNETELNNIINNKYCKKVLINQNRTEMFEIVQHLSFWAMSAEIRHKSSICHVSWQRHISSEDCARELFKPSKDLASFWVCNEKIFFGFRFFRRDVTSRMVLGLFGPLHLAPGQNC